MSKKFRLIPSVLYKNGSVVKSLQYKSHRVVGDLSSTMRVFSRRQADELIIFDLDASIKRKIDWTMIKICVENSNMPLTYGGGVVSSESAISLISRGFDKVCLNSIIFDNPDAVTRIAKSIGSSSTLASIDIKKFNSELYIFSSGGSKMIRLFDLETEVNFLKNIGVGEIIINRIDCDGLMNGYNFEKISLETLNQQVPILISGGCSGSECIKKAYEKGFDGAIMSSIFLWKGDSIPSLKNELRHKVPVREIV